MATEREIPQRNASRQGIEESEGSLSQRNKRWEKSGTRQLEGFPENEEVILYMSLTKPYGYQCLPRKIPSLFSPQKIAVPMYTSIAQEG